MGHIYSVPTPQKKLTELILGYKSNFVLNLVCRITKRVHEKISYAQSKRYESVTRGPHDTVQSEWGLNSWCKFYKFKMSPTLVPTLHTYVFNLLIYT